MSKLTIGHLSDMHLIGEMGAEGTMLRLKEAGGDPQGSLERCLKELAEERPDLLLITGDMCHEGTAADYDGLRETIEKHLPGVPVLASLGNHDVRDAFRKGFLGDTYGGDHPYCDMLELGGFRFISIDSAYEKKLTGNVGDGQLDWLEKAVLPHAPKGNVLLTHHPMCPELSRSGMEMSPRLERIIRGGGFAALFNGHVHRSCVSEAAGVLHITGQSLSFDIEVRNRTCYYTTRGGYHYCTVDDNGAFFVESRITCPKGEVFLEKQF